MKNYISRKIFLLNEARKHKTFVFILSSMRSGSTLLKSLLANAPDTSHLPEHDFQKYTPQNAWKMKALSPARIIILKKPAPFEHFNYPQIPSVQNGRIIILVRDAYEVVTSVKKMNQAAYPELDRQWTQQRLLLEYWLTTYQKLANLVQNSSAKIELLRYEDLLQSPIAVTEKLFHFIGSEQQNGVDTYAPPKSYNWAWGNDDGGEKIKSNKVQKLPLIRDDESLIELIQQSETVQHLRQRLGYI